MLQIWGLVGTLPKLLAGARHGKNGPAFEGQAVSHPATMEIGRESSWQTHDNHRNRSGTTA